MKFTLALFFLSLSSFSYGKENILADDNFAMYAINTIDKLLPEMIQEINSCNSSGVEKVSEEIRKNISYLRVDEAGKRRRFSGSSSCISALSKVDSIGRYVSEHVPANAERVIGYFVDHYKMCKRTFDETIPLKTKRVRPEWPNWVDRPNQCIMPNEVEKLAGKWRLVGIEGDKKKKISKQSWEFDSKGNCRSVVTLSDGVINDFPCYYWFENSRLYTQMANNIRKFPDSYLFDADDYILSLYAGKSKNDYKLKFSYQRLQ